MGYAIALLIAVVLIITAMVVIGNKYPAPDLSEVEPSDLVRHPDGTQL